MTRNKSSTYLLPLLNKTIGIEFDYLLINTFIKYHKSIGEYENTIGLLFEIEDTEAFKEYMSYLESHPSLVRHLTIYYTRELFIFKFPEEYLFEYNLFKEGKYSKFTQEAKSIIISYSAKAYKYPPILEDLTGVLWKHKTRREKLERELGITLPKDCELASKINYESETFYIPEECQS